MEYGTISFYSELIAISIMLLSSSTLINHYFRLYTIMFASIILEKMYFYIQTHFLVIQKVITCFFKCTCILIVFFCFLQ